MKIMQQKAFELGAKKILSRAEMKNVIGGASSEDIKCATCTYKTADGNSHTVTCNVNENGVGCVCPDGMGCATL